MQRNKRRNIMPIVLQPPTYFGATVIYSTRSHTGSRRFTRGGHGYAHGMYAHAEHWYWRRVVLSLGGVGGRRVGGRHVPARRQTADSGRSVLVDTSTRASVDVDPASDPYTGDIRIGYGLQSKCGPCIEKKCASLLVPWFYTSTNDII